MESQKIKSTCTICTSDFSRSGMTRHLKSCLAKHFKATSKTKAKPIYYLHVHATYNPDYFLHILITAHAKLEDLDTFLRNIWLECCGHMSSFTHPCEYQEVGMNTKISEIFAPGTVLSYMYDFGDTTELTVRCIERYTGAIKDGKKIQIVSRNTLPPRLCDDCNKNPAEIICVECQWEGEGWICKKCAQHHECDDEMFLPVVNSPRAGVCGYIGE